MTATAGWDVESGDKDRCPLLHLDEDSICLLVTLSASVKQHTGDSVLWRTTDDTIYAHTTREDGS